MNTTLLIDGNWLLMSRFGVVKNQFLKSLDEDTLQKSSHNLLEFLASSIQRTLLKFNGSVNNIVLVQDGGSWRKSVTKPSCLSCEYKGNRKKDAEIAWNYIFEALTALCESFQKHGITCTCEGAVEGDDWMYFWSRYLNKKSINCIIWSTDADLKQLVCRNSDAAGQPWTIWYNEKQGIVAPEALRPLSSTEDNLLGMMMELEGSSRDSFNSLTAEVRCDVQYISPEAVAVNKILTGDSGDNISPMIWKENTKTGRRTGLSRVILETWGEEHHTALPDTIHDLDAQIRSIIAYALSCKRMQGTRLTKDDAMEMYEHNKVMVWLSEKVIPKTILSVMETHGADYKKADLDEIKRDYKILCTEDTVGKTRDRNTQDLFTGINVFGDAQQQGNMNELPF